MIFSRPAVFVLLTGLSIAASGQTISDVRVTAVTRTTARIEWSSTSSGPHRVYYGMTPYYDRVLTEFVVFNGVKHSAVLTGLRTGQVTYFCPAPVGGSVLPECVSNPAAFSVRTVAAAPAYPKPPTPVLSTEASLTGSTFLVASDCSNLQQMINQAAAANPDQTHEVIIPAGTLCSDRYILPDRPATAKGWVLIKGDAPAGNLPGSNTQIDASYEAQMPILRTNYVSVWFWNTPPEYCSLGEFWWKANATDWALYKCVNTSGGWELIPAKASGTTIPNDCNVGDWFHKTDAVDRHRTGWWCTAPGKYEPVFMDNGGAFFEFAAVRASTNATKYQFIGVQITHIPLPLPYAAQFNTPGSRKKGNTSGCLVWTPETSNQIVFDRVWFRGQGYPSSLWYGFCKWDGRNHVIKNSLFSEVNRWMHPASGEDDSRAINVEAGPGPALIENNTFQNVVGIAVFFSDDLGPLVTMPSDYTIRRNRFLLSDAYNAVSPESNGRYYYHRHHLELKRGIRFLIEGNTFDGGWSAVSQGATLMLTPRLGYGNASDNQVGITDFSFQDNFVRNTPQVGVIIGHADGPPAHPLTTQRLLFRNNLVTGLSGNRSGWGGSGYASGQLLNIGLGIEDFFMENNTVLDTVTTCCLPNFLSHAWSQANAGLVIKNNVFSSKNSSSAGIWYGGMMEGRAALNMLWNEYGAPSYRISNNYFSRPGSVPTSYPPGITWGVSASGFGIADDGSRSSPTLTYGADLARLKSTARLIENLRIEKTGNSASVIFKIHAPELRPRCTVDTADNPLFDGASQLVDTSTGSDKVISIRGLRSGTSYHIRVDCESQPQILQYTH